MSSISGNSGYRDADTHLENPISSSTKCSDGSKLHPSFTGSEDAQESDGDDSGYIHQTVNEVYEKKETGKFVSGCLSLKSSDEEDEGLAAALQQMFSETQTQVILIPAIKGSREKHGLSPRKLNVSWAEDVYDPPPSIMSHTRGKRQNQPKSKAKDNNHKKNGKKGHKGSSNSSSRGGKDKKQSSRKHGNGSGSRDKFQMRIAVACS